MPKIDGQDGFYSQGLGRMVYHDDRISGMGDWTDDLFDSAKKAAQAEIDRRLAELKNGNVQNATSGNVQTVKDGFFSNLFNTETGQQANTMYLQAVMQHAPKALQEQYAKNPTAFHIGALALGAGLIWFLLPSGQKRSMKATVTNLVKPSNDAKPSNTALVMGNPILSLMGMKNAKRKGSMRRKKRRK